MRNLTPIPDASPIAVATALSLCLGARPLAGRLQGRVAPRRDTVARWCYPGVLAVIAVYGGWAIGLAGRRLDGRGVILAVAVGLLAGWAASRLDRWITRRALRQLIARPRRPTAVSSKPGGGSSASCRRRGLARARAEVTSWSSSRRLTEQRLAGLVTIAVLEETIFRGVITQAALDTSSPFLQIGVLAAGCLAFALSHAWFGPGQFSAKAGLAIATLLALFVTGTLLAPIVAHVLVNVHAWEGSDRLVARLRHATSRGVRQEVT